MTQPTTIGRGVFQELARAHGLEDETVAALARAVARGEGRVAEFNIDALGGVGAWAAGGSTRIARLNDAKLRAAVGAVCDALAARMARDALFDGPVEGFWWPARLGEAPSFEGRHGAIRYAYFRGSRRLAVDLGPDQGGVIVLDTGKHAIGGFSADPSRGDAFGGLCFGAGNDVVPVARLELAQDKAPLGGLDENPAAAAGAFAGQSYGPRGAAARETAYGRLQGGRYNESAGAATPISALSNAAAHTETATDRKLARIRELAALHASGALSAPEFERLKSEIITGS